MVYNNKKRFQQKNSQFPHNQRLPMGSCDIFSRSEYIRVTDSENVYVYVCEER